MATRYTMPISAFVVDKLGVKLYDKASAVIAELISNSYDADARSVVVRAPMGQFLASRAGGVLTDKGFTIEVEDNGTGMTPDQMQAYFLPVGTERRDDPSRGSTSPILKRMVMGRKGVGKLAPFGICRIIEVISAGGKKCTRKLPDGTESTGYLTSHVILDYDEIKALGMHPERTYEPAPGDRDGTLSKARGTTVRLRNFSFRRVPTIDVLARQIAQRFGITRDDWRITICDTEAGAAEPRREVGEFDVKVMPGTKVIFDPNSTPRSAIGPAGNPLPRLKAGFDLDGKYYGIRGWIAYSEAPYKDDLMAGIRIYCRGKIAAQTSVFGKSAGFTGEHNVRSYLVGELHADWLDRDDDLIQTNRRDILWSDPLGERFQQWGQEAVGCMGKIARDPARMAILELFLSTGEVEKHISDHFPGDGQEAIRDNAVQLAKSFGRTFSRADAEDQDVVRRFVNISIMLAPHITLDSMMREVASRADAPVDVLSGFLRTARIAELSSFGQIAKNRIKVIRQLDAARADYDEHESTLQQLIEAAPWLIRSDWAPVTANQTLGRLRKEFERYYNELEKTSIALQDFDESNRRPDFVLFGQDNTIQVVEIKRPGHAFTNKEMDRIASYYRCMQAFLKEPGNEGFAERYGDFHITLVCDKLSIDGVHEVAFERYRDQKRLTHLNWTKFLVKTEDLHRDFLDEAKRQRRLAVTDPEAV